MQPGKAILFGVIGAAAISVLSAVLRGFGVPLSIEILLGTLTGWPASPWTFGIGLVMHLVMGGMFGLLYGALFERVWNHGGAPTGAILAVIHASLIGILIGLTPSFHPLIPEHMAEPGPYFSRLGVVGVLAFFAAHIVYGVIVGAGYGHVSNERQWAPTGRL